MNENVVDGIRPLVADLVAALDRFEPTDAAELERIALEGIGPFGHPALPDEVVGLLPEALYERGDEMAAGVLAAFAELGPPPLRAFAAEARDRLASAGVRSPLASELGMLDVAECHRGHIEASGDDILLALLRRPGEPSMQAVAVILEHESCGGVIVSALAGNENLRMLAEPALAVGGEEVIEEVTAALEHMVEHGIELDVDDLPALLLLERAFTGSVGAWPRPALAPPQPDEEDLVEAFAEKHGEDAAFVAHLLCDWKREYADGPLDEWPVADLREFLLDWYPHKGDSDDESLALVPVAVSEFLRFLEVDDVEALVAEVEQLRPEFERKARDPGNWGPAKAMVERMRTEGLDPAEPGALEAWVEGFNARPFEERNRVLAPSLPRPAPRSVERRKTQRRTAKASRKRNRR